MLVRLIIGAGLFAAGYYLGREIGRHEPLRRELEHGRATGRSAEVFDARRPRDGRTGEPLEDDGNDYS